MFPPFPEEDAFEYCKKIISAIEDGSACLVRRDTESERSGHGVMFGVLTCSDASGNEVVLAALSGLDAELNIADESALSFIVCVPPVVSQNQIDEALRKNDREIHELTEKINVLHASVAVPREISSEPDEASAAHENSSESDELSSLISRRKKLTTESLAAFHALYSFHCADGKVRSLTEICRKYNHANLPPTGTGDCAEPKLLNYAYSHCLTPKSLCNVFYGKENTTRKHFLTYGPCDERCGILLPAMLGLRIIYRDKNIIVVNKQSGVLSVPGRGPEKQDCIVSRVRRLFPECIQQPSVHRLDMETSGLMVLAFDAESHRKLNRQFEEGTVKKQYCALIDGVLAKNGIADHGIKELYFRLDVDNRPHQIWDAEFGKKAVTEWQVDSVHKYTAPDGKTRNVTRVIFTPHTGRTHQLRLCASDIHGFGLPIVGDTLYGKCEEGERLMLHARYLEFTHPVTGERMSFTCPEEF